MMEYECSQSFEAVSFCMNSQPRSASGELEQQWDLHSEMWNTRYSIEL